MTTAKRTIISPASLKKENLNKISRISEFKENWNGNGARTFSQKAVRLFKTIIESLEEQPEIAPTGRNSLYLQYSADNDNLLAFEVSEEKVEKVLVKNGDFDNATAESANNNLIEFIEKNVRDFYSKDSLNTALQQSN